VYLYSLCIELEAILGDEKLLNILALISLQLNHLAHLTVVDDRAIASELLLDDFEDLLLVELLGQALDCGQSLATIALCDRRSAILLCLFFVAQVTYAESECECSSETASLR
jgi:hypothetical protein